MLCNYRAHLEWSYKGKILKMFLIVKKKIIKITTCWEIKLAKDLLNFQFLNHQSVIKIINKNRISQNLQLILKITNKCKI